MTVAAPHLHDGLPGILGLAVVAVMVALACWVRARSAARRTLTRYHTDPPAPAVTVQPRDTVAYDGSQSPVLVDAEGTPE